MKITTDYVTNSSSANYVIARKGKLNKSQIKKLIECIESDFLGEMVLKHNATEEEIQNYLKDAYLTDEEEQMLREELKEGKDIYEGMVSFEEAENDIAELYDDIWTALEDEDNICFIKGDLEY